MVIAGHGCPCAIKKHGGVNIYIQLHYEQQLGACLLEHGWDLGPLTSRLGEVFWRTVADWWDEIRGVR